MRFVAVVALSAISIASPALAKSPKYLGAWVITESVPAPWIKSDAELFNDERVALVGKRIVFAAKDISGPSPMGCKGPRYKIKQYPADMLFQGTLTEPAKQAAALGYKNARIATLETGCEGLLDYHFVDADTAKFALNNAIYTVKRAN